MADMGPRKRRRRLARKQKPSRTERLLAFRAASARKNIVSNAGRFDDIGVLYRIAAGTARSWQA
jgi:hypothetical protein